ncbi:MAG: HAD-IIB family hydrolase [Rhodospirillales bacterium]|jgi:HAD superfamily hydrolase (TIGR01484 family)|nr:HAD-IIB family hydrolase [Rhodospirillales bacterium]
MKPLSEFTIGARRNVRGVLTDIDDTITTDGKLTAHAYGACERLHDAGFMVIPITGRPAGWCDHFARMWPVDGIVGENGAFYFRYEAAAKKMTKRFLMSDALRTENRKRLTRLRDEILKKVPGAGVASDQLYREADLAIDFCEDVPALANEAVSRIVAIMTAAGATAKVSSIHVNGWFGDYDKLSMTRIMMAECFGIDIDAEKERFVYIGDSPNDVPMFGFFPHSVGNANVRRFEGALDAEPTYVTKRGDGAGFAEMADFLIAARR